MMYSGKVRRKLEKINELELYDDLLAGEDLESIKPTKELLRISDAIKSNPSLCSIFLEKYQTIELNHLSQIDEDLFMMVKGYIKKYQNRVPGELKLESHSLKENIRPIFQILASYCQDSTLSLETWEARENKRRKEAEKKLRLRMGKPAVWLFQSQIKKLRQGVRFREAMRLDRANSFGFFRQCYRALGYALVSRGCLETLEDIFYLSLEEIEDFLCGQAFFDNPKSLIKLRKRQYQMWEGEELPHQIQGLAPFNK